LAVLHLQAIIDGGYAAQTNASLLMLEMMAFLRRDAPAPKIRPC